MRPLLSGLIFRMRFMMGMLMIRCPTKGVPVSTGVGMDKASFDNPANRVEGNTFKCPACGQVHTWGKGQAFYSDQ